MKKSFKQRMVEEMSGIKEENVRIDASLPESVGLKPLVYRHSRSRAIFLGILGIVYLIFMSLPKSGLQTHWQQAYAYHIVLFLFLIVIPVFMFGLMFSLLRDRSVQLQVDAWGITTPKEQVPWHNVKSVKFRQERGSHFLKIETNDQPILINLYTLAVNEAILGHYIALKLNKPSRQTKPIIKRRDA